MHHGKIIQRLIAGSSYTLEEIASKLSVSEDEITQLYDKAHLSEELTANICQTLSVSLDFHLKEEEKKYELETKYNELLNAYYELLQSRTTTQASINDLQVVIIRLLEEMEKRQS